MSKKPDEDFININGLKLLTGFENLSRVRRYVYQYKIFIPAKKDSKDGRTYLFDRRCVYIRFKLLDCFTPFGIPIGKVRKYLNQVCGINDAKISNLLKTGKNEEEILVTKKQELEEKLNEVAAAM